MMCRRDTCGQSLFATDCPITESGAMKLWHASKIEFTQLIDFSIGAKWQNWIPGWKSIANLVRKSIRQTIPSFGCKQNESQMQVLCLIRKVFLRFQQKLWVQKLLRYPNWDLIKLTNGNRNICIMEFTSLIKFLLSSRWHPCNVSHTIEEKRNVFIYLRSNSQCFACPLHEARMIAEASLFTATSEQIIIMSYCAFLTLSSN